MGNAIIQLPRITDRNKLANRIVTILVGQRNTKSQKATQNRHISYVNARCHAKVIGPRLQKYHQRQKSLEKLCVLALENLKCKISEANVGLIVCR